MRITTAVIYYTHTVEGVVKSSEDYQDTNVKAGNFNVWKGKLSIFFLLYRGICKILRLQ